MDKKKTIIIIIIAFLIFLICFLLIPRGNDSLKFKSEYENLNGKKNKNNREYVNVEIDKNNPFIYADYDKVIDILENGTGVIYFGFPECPWCRTMVPILAKAANEIGVDKIYYFNALDMRDEKVLDDDGNIVTKKEGTKQYYQLIEIMYDYVSTYEGLNDDSVKRLYFPTVVFIKDGDIIGSHIGTLDSQEDPYIPLDDTQKNELKDIYIDYMNDVFDLLCDEAC